MDFHRFYSGSLEEPQRIGPSGSLENGKSFSQPSYTLHKW